MSSPVRVSARTGYALWAATWDSTPSPVVALEERLLEAWIRSLKPRRAIDIGCGTGRWSQRLSAFGFDMAEQMLAVAAQKPGLRGRLAMADAGALPLATGCADLLLCTLTLGHVRNWAAAVREFARVLTPAGTLLLTDFHPAAAARGWRRTFRHQDQVYELEHYRYTLAEIEEAAPNLKLSRTETGCIAEAERRLFLEAGRPELFDEALGTPLVLLSQWTRA
jgi:ubiquinone/menaquinone biosynthesis C-methylase UbiE